MKGEILSLHRLGFSEGFIRKVIQLDCLELWKNSSFQDLLEIYPRLSNKHREVWDSRDLDLPEKILEDLNKKEINFILLTDNQYPYLLKQIFDPPPILYYRGNLSAFVSMKKLSVVGSRKMTSYGKRVIENIFQEISTYDISIISGLAYGVDAYAHEIALKKTSKVVAVLGSGLDNIYPKSNYYLYKKIVESGGLIISPFLHDENVNAYNFPLRNRIISGLSNAVLVVEANKKSGSLITARQALDQNREVMVVPGDIYRESSEGCNLLIRQGAVPVLNHENILETLGLNYFETPKATSAIENPDQIKIIEYLSEEVEFDKLLVELGFDAIKLQNLLSQMELEGLIESRGSMWVKR